MHVAEIQRTRLLTAAVGAIEEFGYADAAVSHITARARISRRTFYELFANREDCLTAVLEDALERIGAQIVEASPEGLPWRERVRASLWAILSFFDREPVLARVCVVQASRGSEIVLDRRAQVFAKLASVIDEGRVESPRGRDVSPLMAEGLVGAAHTILHARLLKHKEAPLTDLFGSLMSMIVLPYLGPSAARREHERPAPTPVAGLAGMHVCEPGTAQSDPLQGLSMRLTYRTACVLQVLAAHPGISNRLVGEQAGVSDQGQISKLLSRLERLGLASNAGEGQAKGEPNAWRLTLKGQQLAQSISTDTHARNHMQAA